MDQELFTIRTPLNNTFVNEREKEQSFNQHSLKFIDNCICNIEYIKSKR